MIDIPLSNNRITFTKLMAVMGRGRVLRDCSIRCVDKISNVKFDGTAIFATKGLGIEALHDERIVGVIVTPEFSAKLLKETSLGVWECPDPQDLFFSIHEYFVETKFVIKPWKNQISKKAKISPYAVIGDHSVTIGDECMIEDSAVIHPYTIIGNESRIGSLCDIGSDGFEVHNVNGVKKVVNHGGLLIIGTNVEVLQLVKIARGLSPSRNTEIHDNVKIDSLTHIAHGVVIETNAVITGGVTIAGNTNIHENAYVGPGAIVSNRIILGKDSYASIGSVVISNLKKGSIVSGNFAVNHQDNLTRHLFLKTQIKKND